MNEAAVKKLAELSRLELTDEEVLEYAGEFSSILEYIDSLNGASTGVGLEPESNSSSNSGPELESNPGDSLFENALNRNVVREDVDPGDPGRNTKKLLAEAPETKDGYIKVKKVL